MRHQKKRKLFCEYNRLFYHISVQKENLRRELLHLSAGLEFAQKKSAEDLPCIVKGHRSPLLRRLLGVDMQYQHNKVQNLALAAKPINNLLIQPGQTFSFWKCIGNPTAKKGYLEGFTLSNGKVGHDIGGGLCQLANMLSWLLLHSPLVVTERHHHTDCVFPDERRSVPFGTGTSVFYKNVDFQFKNTTKQDVQFKIWLDDDYLCGELRTETPFANLYQLKEEGHHFAYAGKTLYRNSQVYRLVYERQTRQLLTKELLLNNHCEVLYDYSLVNPDEIVGTPHVD